MSHLPKWSKPASPITIEECRQLAALHGQDVLVLVAWDKDTNTYQTVTVGSSRLYADAAVRLREKIVGALNLTERTLLEDRRHEHDKP